MENIIPVNNQSSGVEDILELAEQQKDLYMRRPFELISHYKREVNALDVYRGRQLLELLKNGDCTLRKQGSQSNLPL